MLPRQTGSYFRRPGRHYSSNILESCEYPHRQLSSYFLINSTFSSPIRVHYTISDRDNDNDNSDCYHLSCHLCHILKLSLFTFLLQLLVVRRGQCQQVELREEGGAARYLGGGTCGIFKTKMGDNLLKSESFFRWCSKLFCLFFCQFLTRFVWQKI